MRIVSVPEDLKGHTQELDILRERLSLNSCRYFWGAFAILGIALLAAYLFDNWRIFGFGFVAYFVVWLGVQLPKIKQIQRRRQEIAEVFERRGFQIQLDPPSAGTVYDLRGADQED